MLRRPKRAIVAAGRAGSPGMVKQLEGGARNDALLSAKSGLWMTLVLVKLCETAICFWYTLTTDKGG